VFEHRYNLGLHTLCSETEIACAFIFYRHCENHRPTVLTGKFSLGPTVRICDDVGPSDGLCSRQNVKKRMNI